MSTPSYDAIMIGGGLMGCATAYYLMKADDSLKVAIIEMDPTYEKASTPLSDGNIRVQFSLKENIQISQYGLEVVDRFAQEMAVGDQQPDLAFRRQGNIFLVDEEGRAEAEERLALQKSLGCQVEWLTPVGITERHPLLDTHTCAGGTWGRGDGTMDPWALLVGYKDKAISLGAQYVHGQVTDLLSSGSSIAGVELSSGDRLASNHVVNSAGAWAPQVSRVLGIELPVLPINRQVFVIETNARPDTTLPMIMFPSGLYLIHEQEGLFMCGKSLPDDPVGYDLTWDRQTFMESLWPELVDYVPSFDRLKVTRGWGGLYAVNTLDGNAIVGEWPELAGFYLATGFSGHGFQQAPAVGRYLAESIMGQPPSLDLSIFSPRRILENKPVYESKRMLI